MAVRAGRVTRGGATLLAAAALVLAIGGAPVALAGPSDQPGGTSGVLDSQALEQLQAEAARVQADLRARQADVAAAEQRRDQARATADTAAAALADAERVLAERRQVVADYAAAVYRDGGGPSPVGVLLTGGGPGDVVEALASLEAVERHTTGLVAAAEDQRRQSADAAHAAQTALSAAEAATQQVDAEAERLRTTAAAVTDRLDRALQQVDRQLAELQQQQVDVDDRTYANWRAYLQQLADAGVTPPPAGQLRDPVAGLPAGLAPVGASGGGAQPGAAQLPRTPNSLLVLPVEAVSAVSAAMEQLGVPYAPGTAGPDSFDCGSLASTAYAAAGVALPADQAGLFSVTTPVAPADVLPGDLVFLGDADSGLGHVGIALDRQTMVAADARAGAVVVRAVPADQVLGVGRPSLAPRAPVPAPGPSGSALRVECGNTVYPPSYDGTRAWGGYPNGLIPPKALCSLGAAGHSLRCDAAAAYKAMSAAYRTAFGGPLCITDSYRSYASQVRLYGEKPALAAVPGTSNHGWGLAVDLCGGVDGFGTPQYRWMQQNAGRFGFVHPSWADPGQGREEPWHWEYAAG